MIILRAGGSCMERRLCVIVLTRQRANARWTRSSIARENRWRCCNPVAASLREAREPTSLSAERPRRPQGDGYRRLLVRAQLEIDLHLVIFFLRQPFRQWIDVRHPLGNRGDRFI